MTCILSSRSKRWGVVLLPLLFVFVLSFSVTAPKPAAAQVTAAVVQQTWLQQAAEWVKSIAVLGDIVKVLTAVNDGINDVIKTVIDQSGLAIAVHTINDHLKSLLAVSIHKDEKATMMAVAINQVVAQKVADNYVDPTNTLKCHTFLIYQGKYAQAMAQINNANAFQQEGEQRDLGPNADGAGPISAYENYLDMCGGGTEGAKLGHPKLVDPASNPPGDCKDSGKWAGKGTSFGSLTSGAYVFERPPFKQYTVTGSTKTIYVANPKTDEQKGFVALQVAHKNLLGPRPTPVSGEFMFNPKNITNTQIWNHCAAIESASDSPCTLLMAQFVRPTCEDSTEYANNKAQCDASAQACLSAGARGVPLPNMPEYACGQFSSDGKGGYTMANKVSGSSKLSPYQSAKLTWMACSTNKNAIDDQTIAALMACNSAWNTYNATVGMERDGCVAAAASLAKLNCWPASK